MIFGSETRNGHGPGHIEHPLVGEIREKGNLELESDSSEHHGNATQFGFGNDISGKTELRDPGYILAHEEKCLRGVRRDAGERGRRVIGRRGGGEGGIARRG